MGSQSKPPTLLRDEYPQWKIKMVSFLEGVDPGLTEFLYNPPYIPTIVVPGVPATTITAETLKQIKPKKEKDLSQEERDKHALAVYHC